MKVYLIHICVLLFVNGCLNQQPVDKGQAIAHLDDAALYKSDIPSWMLGHKDSTLLINAFTDKWIRKRIMLEEAEKVVDGSINIDQMVRDYKESLLLHQYEKQLIEKKLNAEISNIEINTYYAEHMDEFLLQEDLYQCAYVHTQNADVAKQIDKYWKKDNSVEQLTKMDNSELRNIYISNQKWIEKSKITATLPTDIVKKINWKSNNKQAITVDSNYIYIHLNEHLSPRDKAPLSYVKDDIIKLILHHKKKELLLNIEDSLYQRRIKNKDISISK